jgi:hypothetical protein
MRPLPPSVGRSALPALVLLASWLPAACEGPLDPGPPADAPFVANIVAGRAAFIAECASCHAARDGFDLAFFAFTDTTVVRRALAHVDLPTARNIAAYIRSLDVRRAARTVRPFQPGGAVLDGDAAFAVRLFGADALPAGLGTVALRAIDPLHVPVAVALPLWSVEASNTDWMPGIAPTEGVLGWNGAAAQAAVAGYYAAPTEQNLQRAVNALRTAERRADNPGAPCLVDDVQRAEYGVCFEVRRWTSSLVAQHLLRHDRNRSDIAGLHDVFWDTGNAVRKAIQVGRLDFPNGDQNWAGWMYLGFMFEPGRHASVYTGNGLMRIGLPRHATFVALRAMVARGAGSAAVYTDVESAARFAPGHWAFDATRVAFAHALERLAAGDRPAAAQLETARARVESAMRHAARKVTPAQAAVLAGMRDALLAGLADG